MLPFTNIGEIDAEKILAAGPDLSQSKLYENSLTAEKIEEEEQKLFSLYEPRTLYNYFTQNPSRVTSSANLSKTTSVVQQKLQKFQMNRRNLRQNHGRIRNSNMLDTTAKKEDVPEENEDLELF